MKRKSSKFLSLLLAAVLLLSLIAPAALPLGPPIPFISARQRIWRGSPGTAPWTAGLRGKPSIWRRTMI